MSALRRRIARLIRGQSQSGRPAWGQSLMQGGVVNPMTGAGTAIDSSEHAQFAPTWIRTREPLEVLYVQSWAARKAIDIPVEDMLSRGRDWSSERDGDAETMDEAERRHGLHDALRRAVRAGRLYGSALLVMATREDDPASELMPERVRAGDLIGLRVYDRFSASVWTRDPDWRSPTFGRPLVYRVHPTYARGEGVDIHASRVVRFDGLAPLTDDGYRQYDQDWGVSMLVPAMRGIAQDAEIVANASHLSHVASLPVLAIDGLREAAMGQAEPGEPTVEDLGRQVNDMMSVYRLLMLDRGTETFSRVAVQFSGLEGLIERVERRLAAAFDIPATRYYGQSPVGMNATGESDEANYLRMIESMRETMLAEPLRRLDAVLARDAGLAEPPEWTWRSLFDSSDQEQAAAAKMRVEAVGAALAANLIDEDEGRAMLDGTPVFGELPPVPGGLAMEEEEEMPDDEESSAAPPAGAGMMGTI